jgi:hypothetical protein
LRLLRHRRRQARHQLRIASAISLSAPSAWEVTTDSGNGSNGELIEQVQRRLSKQSGDFCFENIVNRLLDLIFVFQVSVAGNPDPNPAWNRLHAWINQLTTPRRH